MKFDAVQSVTAGMWEQVSVYMLRPDLWAPHKGDRKQVVLVRNKSNQSLRWQKRRTGGRNMKTLYYCLYDVKARVQKKMLEEQESNKKRAQIWSIVFGRVQDHVHKFPWHNQGSALSSAPMPKHSEG